MVYTSVKASTINNETLINHWKIHRNGLVVRSLENSAKLFLLISFSI